MTGRLAELTRWLGHAGAAKPDAFPTLRVSAKGGGVDIRTGKASDVPALAPMIAQTCALHRRWDAAKFGFVDDAVPMYCRWLSQRADDPRGVFVVAAAKAGPVAFAIGTAEIAAPIFHPANYGLIRDFWVEDEWRRNGIGREVVATVISRFHAIGIAQVRLETAAANSAARRFFAACGFRDSAVEMLIE
jgi:GNAT superfamily N-acetyltransferase